jgi:hypothetical protein
MKTPFLITGIALLIIGAAFGIYGFFQPESDYQSSTIAGGWIVAVAGGILIRIATIMKEPKLERKAYFVDTVVRRLFEENIVHCAERVLSRNR